MAAHLISSLIPIHIDISRCVLSSTWKSLFSSFGVFQSMIILFRNNKYSLDYNVEDQVINAIQYLSVSLWVLNSYLSYRLFFKLQMDPWFCWKPKIRKRYELTCHSVLNMFLPIRYSMHIYYFSLFSTMEGKQYRWSITKDMMSWRFYQMHCL